MKQSNLLINEIVLVVIVKVEVILDVSFWIKSLQIFLCIFMVCLNDSKDVASGTGGVFILKEKKIAKFSHQIRSFGLLFEGKQLDRYVCVESKTHRMFWMFGAQRHDFALQQRPLCGIFGSHECLWIGDTASLVCCGRYPVTFRSLWRVQHICALTQVPTPHPGSIWRLVSWLDITLAMEVIVRSYKWIGGGESL